MARRSAALAALLVLVLPLAARAAPAPPAAIEPLARAQELLDAGQPEAALRLIEPVLKQHPDDPRGLLLRSTARLLLGDTAAGRRDLERALTLDPGVRQAWLNRAALDIAEKRYEAALQALEAARRLDPTAADNEVNIGAVLLLKGELQPASARFATYLQANPTSADAYYLVASNYALAGYSALAIEHLRRAVALDERARLRARTDPNFRDLAAAPPFQQLLATDAYRPPPGAYVAEQIYAVPYDLADGALLGAVIDALKAAGHAFDPRVEATPDWALIWGELRVKVSRTPDGKGRVELSTPATRLTPAEWRERTARLFRDVAVRLASRGGAATQR